MPASILSVDALTLHNAPGAAANSPPEAFRAWASMHGEKPTAFMNYREESQRLLLWSALKPRKPLLSLTKADRLL